MRRFRSNVFLVTLVCMIFFGTGLVSAIPPDSGKLIIFMAEQEVGYEDFTFDAHGLITEGLIEAAGQRVVTETSLQGSLGVWEAYELSTSGVNLSGQFVGDRFDVSVGPLEQSFDLTSPFAVFDNNVFAHYQQVIDLAKSGASEITLVTPVLALMGQSPILTGTVAKNDPIDYLVNGELITLEEYSAILPGSLYVQVLADADGHLVSVRIPAQSVEAKRSEYVDMQEVSTQADKTWIDEEFIVDAGEVSLAGALSFPIIAEEPYPVILLNSGSGPQDRDGNTPPAFMTNMFGIMAERFTEQGVAVLRYDERGVGQSTGDYDQADFTDLVNDVQALIDFLKAHPQIDQTKIAILGHSEGGYIAPLIAQNNPEIAGVVILAGPSTSLDQIMIEQLDYQHSLPFLSAEEISVIEQLIPLTEQALEDARAGKSESVLPYNLDWIRDHMAHDPIATIQNVNAPVLIIHGDRDLKVMPYHAGVLAEALQAIGNTQVEVHILPETTHDFMIFPLDNPEYDPSDPWKITPELYDIIAEWLSHTLM